MDIEYAFWQMYLMLTNPKIVYRHTMYRKRASFRAPSRIFQP